MPALWPSSGAADSQAPRWAAASLSRSAADACGITTKDAATIAALVRTIFPFFVAFIATPVLRANIAHLIRDGVRCIRDWVWLRRQALSAKGSLIGRPDRVIASSTIGLSAAMRGIEAVERLAAQAG